MRDAPKVFGVSEAFFAQDQRALCESEVGGWNTEKRWTNLHLQLRFFRLQRIGQLLQVLAVARREGSRDLALFQLALFNDAHAVGDDDLGAEEQPLGEEVEAKGDECDA